jgi:hypothetical protein
MNKSINIELLLTELRFTEHLHHRWLKNWYGWYSHCISLRIDSEAQFLREYLTDACKRFEASEFFETGWFWRTGQFTGSVMFIAIISANNCPLRRSATCTMRQCSGYSRKRPAGQRTLGKQR